MRKAATLPEAEGTATLPWILGVVLGLKCRSSRIREGRTSSKRVPSAACTTTRAQDMTPWRCAAFHAYLYFLRDKIESGREVAGRSKSVRSDGGIEADLPFVL